MLFLGSSVSICIYALFTIVLYSNGVGGCSWISLYTLWAKTVFTGDLCAQLYKNICIRTRIHWDISCSIIYIIEMLRTYHLYTYIMEILNLILTFFFLGIKSSFMFLVKCAYFVLYNREFCCVLRYICVGLGMIWFYLILNNLCNLEN